MVEVVGRQLQDEQQELRQQEMDLYITKFQEQLAIDQKMVLSARAKLQPSAYRAPGATRKLCSV